MRRLMAVLVVGATVGGLAAVGFSAEEPAAATQEIVLPAAQTTGGMSLNEALQKRRSIRGFQSKALTQEQVGQLLWAAQGITDAAGHRTAPSAMARYPMAVWLFDANGAFRYEPKGHKLVRVAEGDHRAEVTQPARGGDAAPVSFVITGDPSVFSGRGGDMASRFVYIEAGHVAQNLQLEATALGLAAVPQGGFNGAAITKLLSLPEGQFPVYVMPVGYAAPPAAAR